jgi:dolichol-phosphate mannosyltransferase
MNRNMQPGDERQAAPTRPSRSDTLVSVVLPVYNEVEVLPMLLGRVRQALAALGVRSEIIFVDDGSTDGSAPLLDQIARRCPEVRVIHFSRNFGHQAAVQAGLCHAQSDAVVLMDSDLQDAPEAIGRLLDAWREGYDVVYALRAKRKERAWKRLLFAAFHRTLAAVATTPIPPDAGNFSLIDARVVREIVALSERDRYLPGLRSWVGFRQTGVVVERLARYDDHPRVTLRGLWRLAKTAIFSFSSLPLTIFYLIGYSALAIFLGLAGYSLYCRLFTNLAIPGWTSYILSASFFGALNALGISMLGEYVLRIYDQVRARPLYVIDRTVNIATAVEQHRPKALSSDSASVSDAADSFDGLLTETLELLEIDALAESSVRELESAVTGSRTDSTEAIS